MLGEILTRGTYKERAKKLTVDAIKLKNVGKLEEAIDKLKISKEYYEKIEDYKGIITCNNRIGQIFAQMNKESDAIQQFEKSLRISENTDGLKIESTITLNVIAGYYVTKSEWDIALKYYKQSLEIAQQLQDLERISISYNCIADFYKKRECFKESIFYYKEAIQTTKKIPDIDGLLISLDKLANVYRKIGEWNQAIQCYEDSLKILEDKKDLSEILICIVVIWDICLKNCNVECARRYQIRFVEILKKRGISEDTIINMALNCSYERNEGEWKKVTEKFRKEFRNILNSKINKENSSLKSKIKNDKKIFHDNFEISIKNNSKKGSNWEDIYQFHNNNLENAKKINYKKGILNSLKALGSIYKDNEKSLNYYLQSLEIAKAIDDKKEIHNVLRKIGALYIAQNKFDEAEIYYQESLDVARKIGERNDIYISLRLLGDIYKKQQKYEDALQIYKNAATEIEYESIKELLDIYNSVCTVYRNLKDKENELQYLYECLNITEELNLNDKICSYCHRIGYIYKIKSKYKLAIEYYSRCFNISQEQKNNKRILYYLSILSDLHKLNRDNKSAYHMLTFYTDLAHKLGDIQKEARGLKQIGDLYGPNSEESLKYYAESLRLAKEINSKEEIVDALKSLGDVYFKEEWQRALFYYEEGMKISDEMGFQKKTSNFLIDMGNLYKVQAMDNKSLECYKLSLKVQDNFFKNKGICADNFNFYESFGAKYIFRIHLNFIGDLKKKEKCWEDAEKYYDAAMEISVMLDSKEEIYNTCIKYIELYQSVENWDKALHYSLKAIEFAEDIYFEAKKLVQNSNNKEMIYQSLSNLADSYMYSATFYDTFGNVEKSRKLYEMALKISKDLRYTDEIRFKDIQEGNISFSEKELDRLLDSLDQIDALYPKNKAWEKIRKHCEDCKNRYLKDKSKKEILEVFLIIGDIYNGKDILEKSFQYYEKGLEISRELGDENHISIFLRSQGDLYNKKGNFGLATDYYKESVEICRRIGNYHEQLINLLNIAHLSKDLNIYNECLEISKILGDSRETLNIFMNIGNIYKNNANFGEALKSFKICLKIAREDIKDKKEISNILINIGNVYRDQGEWRNSEKILKACLEFAKKNKFDKVIAKACNELGYLYQDTGEWEQASKYYKSSLRKSKRFNQEQEISISLNFLGNLSQNTGEWDKAKSYLEESIKISEKLSYEKGISITARNLGNLHRNQGEWEKAFKCYKKSIKFAQSIGEKRLIASNLNNIGNLLQNEGKWELALKCYNLGLEFANNIKHKKTIFELLNSKGDLYRDGGRWKEAEEIYLESCSICSHLGYKKGLAISFNNLGHLYQNIGKWNEALKLYGESLELSEDLCYAERISIVNNSMGYLCKQKGDWKKAIEYFNNSIHISKNLNFKKELLKSYNQIGDLYSRFEGDLEKARNYLDESLSLAEQMDNTKGIACSFYFLGLYYRRKGDWDEALTYYEKSYVLFEKIGYKKGMSESLRKKGNLYRDRGIWEESLENYFKSMNISKEIGYRLGTSKCLRNLGNLYRNKGEWNKSLDYYKNSLDLIEEYDYKSKSRCLREIANLYKEECEWETGLVHYNKSLEISKEIGDFEGSFASSNGILEIYIKTGRWEEAKIKIELGLNELDKRSALSQATFLKNQAELLCFKDDYDSAIDKLKKANVILKNSKAKPQKIDVQKRLGEIYLERYKLYKKNIDLKRSKGFLKHALKMSIHLEMPLKAGAIKRSLGIMVAESKEPNSTKINEVRSLFLESIELFRTNKSHFELHKSLLEYSKFLYKMKSYAESEVLLKSIVLDYAICRNYELIVDAYLLLGDIEIIFDKTYGNYKKALEVTEPSTESYLRTCYQLIFRIRKIYRNKILEKRELKELIYNLKNLNTDYYFDQFLEGLTYKIDGLEKDGIKLPNRLEIELKKFDV